jgi:hypothetical protein
MSEDTPAVVQHADTAHEAIRSINHLTRGTVPAPLAYSILGNLKNVGHLLPQALGQIGAGLERSLTEYDVYDRDREPAESVALAQDYLEQAATKAAEMGQLLEKAQSAINSQGYTTADDPA